MFRIKICGITTAEDALAAAEAGADAIGLNFFEESPRFVSPGVAEEIVARLRRAYSAERVRVVAVFVNASLEGILWTVRAANLYQPNVGLAIQLHGDEPPELIRDLHAQGLGLGGDLFQVLGRAPEVPVIRAFRCRSGDLAAPAAYLARCRVLTAMPQAVVVDAFAPGSYGGTGECVDWQALQNGRSALGDLPLILAGGLTPENVAEAIATVKPDCVDVASGVESEPGKKDAAKVRAFAAAARQAFEALHC